MNTPSNIQISSFGDGSGRWLWQISYKGKLFQAGVEFCKAHAARAAKAAQGILDSAIRSAYPGITPPAAEPEAMIDLDAVERGTGEEE